MSEYAERNSMELDTDGGYYCRHIAAMTKEGLYGKSEIADELAWRDREIEKLKKLIAEATDRLSLPLPSIRQSGFRELMNKLRDV